MNKYYFFYGNQVVEYNAPHIPKLIDKKRIKLKVNDSKCSLKLNPSVTKVVLKNVCD